MPEKFYITTPIYYVNARPHIGHAYTTIVADVLARRRRLLGDDVWFLTGTDEHGQKIERSAAAAGVPPQQFADEVSASFQTLWKRMGITNDQYIRTTSEAHKRGVQKLFSELYAHGHIYLSSYTGQYSVGEEMFVEGPPGTIGPDGKPTETVTEENFFFRLGNFQLQLLNLIESDRLAITPVARKNEVLSFLRGDVNAAVLTGLERVGGLLQEGEVLAAPALAQGLVEKTANDNLYIPKALKDLSVSRSSFKWGIPVPEPAASEAKEKHVIYVWLDALANYITAVGYGDDSEEAKAKFAKWWPAELHLVGKEIIRFHCVYWPAFLLAANLQLPKAITAHGWLLFDDSKMSKSKGNIVRTETILKAFGTLCPPAPNDQGVDQVGSSGLRPEERNPSKTGALASALPTNSDRDLFAADVLRYFLLREIPFGQDGSFNFEALWSRYDSELGSKLGNLVNRVLTLIQQYCNSEIPAPPSQIVCLGLPTSRSGDTATVEEAYAGTEQLQRMFGDDASTIDMLYKAVDLNSLLALINLRLSAVNLYLAANAPWKLAKSDVESDRLRFAEVIYTAAEAIRHFAVYLYPILPFSSNKIWGQLGLGKLDEVEPGDLANLPWGSLKPGTKLGPLGPIFPRADKGIVQLMTNMEAANAKPNTPEGANAAADATTGTETEFKVTSLASEIVQAPAENHSPTDPAAGPRTASLPEENPGGLVAGSAAVTTERPATPPHSEAQASGIFASQPADASPQITIDDFAKVELRVAKVLVCERIPKADKLLRLEVDLGYERRQILSGIAEWYTPEDLIGRRIVVITNLAPRKMRGLESHGMLLAGSAEGGKPALATFADTDDLPLGARLK